MWFIGAVVSLAVALTPVAVVLSEHGHHAPHAGCRTVIVAGFMGGETRTVCPSP